MQKKFDEVVRAAYFAGAQAGVSLAVAAAVADGLPEPGEATGAIEASFEKFRVGLAR